MQLVAELDSFALKILQYFIPAIGIYRTENSITVLESKGKGKRYKIINSKSYDISSIDLWKQIKEDFSFKDKLVACNLFSSTGLFKLVEIPNMEQAEIDVWLRENINDFFAIPNILDQSLLSWRIIDSKNDPMTGLVALINKNELENVSSEFTENSIPLSAVSFRELMFYKGVDKETLELHCFRYNDVNTIVLLDHQGLVYYNQVPESSNIQNPELAWNYLDQIDAQESAILEAIKDKIPTTIFSKTIISDKDDAELAETLAQSAFLHPSATFDLLPEKFKIKRDEAIWGNLLKRFALGAGSIVVALMLLAFIINTAITFLTDNIKEDLDSMRPQLVEIDSLNSKREALQKTYTETKKLYATRSRTHLIMEGIAVHIPKDVWLAEIDYNIESDTGYNLALTGYSKKRDAISTFIRAIEKDNNFKSVKLDYINKLSSDDFYKTWKIRNSQYSEFKLTMNF